MSKKKNRKKLKAKAMSVPSGSGGWYPVLESYPGAWQRNVEINPTLASTFYADFSCKTLIARDIAKLRVKLVQYDRTTKIWSEVTNKAFSPVLRKPNDYQTRNQFWEFWILSKLSRGNTYVLKVRDESRVVRALHVLLPTRVQPLVATDGSVFYQLDTNELAGLPGSVTVPSSEIIHDRFNCLFHPLVGVPPLYAAALAQMQGLNIQNQSVRLFANNAQPGGILSAPGFINQETADRLKKDWEDNYGGRNIGKVAVLGDGLKFEKMALTAVEGQMIEQLKWTAEVVCSVHHMPPYKIGVGSLPSYNNVQALNVEYYTQGLQSLIEDAESCLDDGLGLGEQYDLGTEFDVENLLRMDGVAQAEVATKLVQGTILAPNEGRARFDYAPKAGGDALYMQEQNYSLEALAKRDAGDDPFGKQAATPPPPPPPANDADEPEEDDKKEAVRGLAGFFLRKAVAAHAAANGGR